MRQSKREITDRAIIEEILSSEVICRLGLVEGNRPYILPVNYGYRDGCIYIHCAKEGTKIDLIRENPEVCFEVEHGVEIVKGDTACKYSTRFRSVIGYGRAEIQDDDGAKKQGMDVIMAQHGAPYLDQYEPGNLKQMIILKIKITSMTGKQSSNW